MPKGQLKTPVLGVCKLCLQHKELRLSHIIPNAIFRRMYQGSNGNGIQVTGDYITPNKKTSSTWSEHLLCKECERYFNQEFEHKAITMFVQNTKWSTHHEHGVTISNYEMGRLGNFFLSILWRAAISTLPVYEKVQLPDGVLEFLRYCLHYTPAKPCRLFSIQMMALYDPVKHMPHELLKNITISPLYTFENQRVVYHLVILGIYVKIFFPALPSPKKEKPTLNYNRKIFMIPKISMFDVQPLFHVSARGLWKEKNLTQNYSTKGKK